jgi:phosphohistidine phosphatase
MKKIIFVRHGRAEEADPLFTDFERSLTARGKQVSVQMARILNEKETGKILLVSSPAFRAVETGLIFSRIFGYDPDKIILRNALYNRANLNSFAEIIENTPENTDTVILFGHNPSFTEIPDRLSRNGCDFLPKSGIVCLSFKTDTWKGIVKGKGKIEYFLKPAKIT